MNRKNIHKFLFVIILQLLLVSGEAQHIGKHFTPIQYYDSLTKLNFKLNSFEEVLPTNAKQCGVKRMTARNNVDLILHNGFYYMAMRTAPVHFPSGKARIIVFKSVDCNNWECMYVIDKWGDLREPRFLVFNGKLLLYCFEGVKSMVRFVPRNIWACELQGVTWSETVDVNLDGWVPWRFRSINGKTYFSAYYGVDLYKPVNKCVVRLFSTNDGYHWYPITLQPQIGNHGGAEEGEFIFDDEDNLWATVRLEGSGGILAWADKDSLGKWNYKVLNQKYDSALLFKHKGELFLIARRNLDGDAERNAKKLSPKLKKAYNLIRYSLTLKHTALYHIDRAKKEIRFLFDFPSNGDNAFAGIAPAANQNSYIVVNYSSDPFKRPINWFTGQFGKTSIYKMELEIQNSK